MLRRKDMPHQLGAHGTAERRGKAKGSTGRRTLLRVGFLGMEPPPRRCAATEKGKKSMTDELLKQQIERLIVNHCVLIPEIHLQHFIQSVVAWAKVYAKEYEK